MLTAQKSATEINLKLDFKFSDYKSFALNFQNRFQGLQRAATEADLKHITSSFTVSNSGNESEKKDYLENSFEDLLSRFNDAQSENLNVLDLSHLYQSAFGRVQSIFLFLLYLISFHNSF